MPKTQNLLLEIIFFKNFKATIPTTKVTPKATKLVWLIIDELRISLASRRMAPNEAGINKQKEKLNAFRGDKPSKRAEKIVKPDRETPGRMAMAWKIPIMKADK